MAEVIDTAYVDIVPRLNNFGGQLRRDLNKAFKPVEQDVKRIGRNVGAQFGDSFRAAAANGMGPRFNADVARALSSTDTVARRQGHNAGEAYGRAFSRAASERARATPIGVPTPAAPAGDRGSSRGGGGKGLFGGAVDAATGVGMMTIKLGLLASTAGLAGGAVAALTSGVVSLGAAAGPAAGALAVFPGLLAAVGQGAGVAKLGLMGMEDALKGDKQALAKLAPEAREVVGVIADMKPRFESLRRTVQNRMFDDLAKPLRRLAGSYLPMLRTELGQTGAVLNTIAKRGIALARTPAFRADFATILASNNYHLRDMGKAGLNMVNVGRHLAVAIQPLVGRFAKFLVDASARLSVMTEKARKSGDLAAFFKRAGDVAAQLGRIVGNLGVGLFRAFSIGATHGQSLLDTIEKSTAKFKEWTASAGGKNAIAKYFQDGNDTLRAFGRLLGDAGRLLGDSFSTEKLAPIIDQIRVELLPAIDQLFDGMNVDTVIADIVSALADFTSVFAEAGGGFEAFATTLGAIGLAAKAIAENVPFASEALGVFLAMVGIRAALRITGVAAAVSALTTSVWANSAATAFNTSTVGTWLGVKAIEAGAWARAAVTAGFSAVATGIATVATWAAVAATWALNAAMAVLTSPITAVVLVVGFLAGGLIYAYKHSETFRRIVDGAFRAVAAAGKWMWDKVLLPVFKFIIQWWLKVAEIVVTGAEKAFGWVPGLGPKLKKAKEEFTKFKDGVNTALAGISDKSVSVTASLRGIDVRTLVGTGGGPNMAGRLYNGGVVPGTPVVGRDNMVVPIDGGRGFTGLASGEFVVNTRETKKNRPLLEAINAGKFKGMASGGLTVVGRTPPPSAAAKLAATFDARISGTARAVAARLKALAEMAGGGGGPINPGLAGALAWARSQVGKPYIWGGVGPRGYDCSGFMSAITNVIRGKNPYRRLFATGSFPSAGYVRGAGPMMIGSVRGNPGHMAGTLNGVNVESRGGDGVVVGSSARGARSGMFGGNVYRLSGFAGGGMVGDGPFDFLNPRGRQYLGSAVRNLIPAQMFDRGGYLPPGLTLAYNGTGKPERVIGPKGSGDVHLHFHGPVGSKRELEDWLAATFAKLQREGRA